MCIRDRSCSGFRAHWLLSIWAIRARLRRRVPALVPGACAGWLVVIRYLPPRDLRVAYALGWRAS
eukprot:969550-Alexandrium_andersonii.AAC.1